MSLKKIEITEALAKAAEGKEIYILHPISKDTTVSELFGAIAFAEVIPDAAPEEKPVKTKEEVTEQDNVQEPKSRHYAKNVDHGKIVSLRTAGWSVKKIAAQMEISEQTVRNHLAEEDL